MKLTRLGVCGTILLSWALAGPVAAQNPVYPPGPAPVSPSSPDAGYLPSYAQAYGPPPGSEPGFSSVQNGGYNSFAQLNPININPYYRFRTDIGQGVGYYNGFQTGSAFVPLVFEAGRSLFFVDARGFVTNHSDIGGNLGAGLRAYIPETDRVYGLSAWYDNDDSSFRRYQRGGASFESLGQFFDFRANLYFPTNNHSRYLMWQHFTGQAFFLGHNIGLGQTSMFEAPMTGGDFEVGGGLPMIGDYGIRYYLGMYYYDGKGVDGTPGFQTRAEFLVTQNLSGQIALYADRLWGTNITGQITYLLPNGRPARFLSRQPVEQRLYSLVNRNSRIAVARTTDDTPALALRDGVTRGSMNGAAGTPIYVEHVDNTAVPGGNGTYEHPFSNLPPTVPAKADIVYIHHGDGTSNNMNTGITLQDNQRLLGEGTLHTFFSQQGQFVLPGNDLSVSNPIITNINGDAVTLANNNEVSGLTIGNTLANGGGPLTNGIVGAGITDFDINHVLIQNAGANGIFLTDAGGVGNISDTTVLASAQRGILISNTNIALLELTLDTVNAENNGLAGISLQNNASTMVVDATNVTSTDNDTGLALGATNGSYLGFTSTGNNFSFNQNVVNNQVGNGATIIADASTVEFFSTNDKFDSNASSGIAAQFTNNSIFNATFSGTSASDNIYQAGLKIVNADNSNLFIAVSNDSAFDRNGSFGVAMNLSNASFLNFTMDGSSASGTTTRTFTPPKTGDGVFVNADTQSIANISLTDVRINQNARHGVNIIGSNGSQLNINVADSHGSPTPLINDTTVPPSFNPLDINNLGISGNGNVAAIIAAGIAGTSVVPLGDGIRVELNNSTINQLNIDNNLIERNAQAGIELQNNGGTVAVSDITRNEIYQNFGMGIFVHSLNGQTNLTVGGPQDSLGNVFTGNHDAGVLYLADGTSPQLSIVDISHNIISETINTNNPVLLVDSIDADGIVVDLHGKARATATLNDNTIFNNDGSGIQLNISDSAELINSQIARNVIGLDTLGNAAGNDANGIISFRRVNGLVDSTTLTIEDNIIANQRLNGINLVEATGSIQNAVAYNILNNVIYSNGVRANTDPTETAAGNGILIGNTGSTVMTINIAGNSIGVDQDGNAAGNGLDGIRTTGGGPVSRIIGTWENNNISNNGAAPDTLSILQGFGSGINLNANEDLTIQNNIISHNRFDGILKFQDLLNSSTLQILNNTITNNGTTTLDPDNNRVGGVGIELNAVAFHSNQSTNPPQPPFPPTSPVTGSVINYFTDFIDTGTLNVTINNNLIANNFTDGVRITPLVQAFNTIGWANTGRYDVTVSMDNNLVRDNQHRGLYFRNMGGAATSLTVTNNTFEGNGFAGVLIQSDANSQGVFTLPVGPDHGGAIGTLNPGAENNVLFVMTNNEVRGNSQRSLNADFGGAIQYEGGFDLLVGTSQYGKVQADIELNDFSGNSRADIYDPANPPPTLKGSSDVYIGSYVSAEQLLYPSPGVIVPNPLARLDLQFRNNTGDVLAATNTGAYATNVGSGKTDAFGGAGGISNEQRLPIPDIPVLAPPGIQAQGAGASTFRVEQDSLTTNSFNRVLSNFDDAAPGVAGTPPNGGTLDFDWTIVPVGTLFP